MGKKHRPSGSRGTGQQPAPQRRGHRYIEREDLIVENRVEEAIKLVKENNHLTSNKQVANALGLGVRSLYRFKKRKVFAKDAPYLEKWAKLSDRPSKYLTGEWDEERAQAFHKGTTC